MSISASDLDLNRGLLHRTFRVILIVAAIVIGLLQALVYRHAISPDGVAYLDVGDEFWSGNWRVAFTGVRTTLYPILMGLVMKVVRPSAYWEFTVGHLINFGFYLFALAGFHYFLIGWIRRQQSRRGEDEVGFSADAAWFLGYAYFIWSAILLITLKWIVPDMLMSAFIYWAAGIVVRVDQEPAPRLRPYAMLGLLLALAYLTKAAAFPMALIFLAASYCASPKKWHGHPARAHGQDAHATRRAALQRFSIAVGVFILVAGPYIFLLSKELGHPTISDNPRLNYAWLVNKVPRFGHWHGEPKGFGTPIHPTRKLATAPDIYEFATPIAGTLPLWFDPSYWYEGLEPQVGVKDQILALVKVGGAYYELFLVEQGGLLAITILLFLMGARRGRGLGESENGEDEQVIVAQPPSAAILAPDNASQPRAAALQQQKLTALQHLFDYFPVRTLLAEWRILLPPIAAFLIFWPVHVEDRYVGVYMTLFWCGIWGAVRLPRHDLSRRILNFAAIAMLITLGIGIGGEAIRTASQLTHTTLDGRNLSRHGDWIIADGAQKLGIEPGSQVAFIGKAFDAYWARVARVRITAELPGATEFWSLPDAERARCLDILKSTGVRAAVAQWPATIHDPAWTRIGTTDHYVHIFPR